MTVYAYYVISRCIVTINGPISPIYLACFYCKPLWYTCEYDIISVKYHIWSYILWTIIYIIYDIELIWYVNSPSAPPLGCHAAVGGRWSSSEARGGAHHSGGRDEPGAERLPRASRPRPHLPPEARHWRPRAERAPVAQPGGGEVRELRICRQCVEGGSTCTYIYAIYC